MVVGTPCLPRCKIKPRTPAGAIERIGDEHRVVEGFQIDAVAGEDLHVVFRVLKHLEDARVLEHRLEQRQRLLTVHLTLGGLGRSEEPLALPGSVAERDIAGRPGLHGQRHADQFGPHLVEARGFGVHRDPAARVRPVDPCTQRSGVA